MPPRRISGIKVNDRRARRLRDGVGHDARRSPPRSTSASRAKQLPAYDGARASLASVRTASTPGNPKATASALFKIVDADEPPLRVFFGDAGLPMIKREYAERIATWEKWNDVSLEAQGNPHGRTREMAADLSGPPPA